MRYCSGGREEKEKEYGKGRHQEHPQPWGRDRVSEPPPLKIHTLMQRLQSQPLEWGDASEVPCHWNWLEVWGQVLTGRSLMGSICYQSAQSGC